MFPSSLSLALPSELGSIEASHAGTGPLVIHIQEAHGNPEAQEKIRQILHHLHKEYGIDLVLLEGTAFKLHPELIDFYPQEPKRKKDLWARLMKAGLLSGPEQYLAEEKSASAYGIEDVGPYVQNGLALIDVLNAKQQSSRFLSHLDMQIERLTTTRLNQDLRIFLKQTEQFEAKIMTIQGWLSILKKRAKETLKLDLEDPREQIEWPMLLRVFTLKRLEEKTDVGALGTEKKAFLEVLSKFIPKNEALYREIEKNLDTPEQERTLSDPETGLLFEAMVARLPQDFPYSRYPNVNRFIGHLILQSELKGDRFFREMKKLEGRISDQLAPTPVEKEIVSILKDYQLLKKLFVLELTPEDYERVLARKAAIRPAHVIGRFAKLNQDKRVRDMSFEPADSMEVLFDKALEFYLIAKERDGIMTQNIEKRLKETGKTKAVVITGGFHAQPFENSLVQKGFAYARITPRMIHPGNTDQYTKLVLETFAPRSSTWKLVPLFQTLPEQLSLLGYRSFAIRDIRRSLGPTFPHAPKSGRSEMRTVQFKNVPANKLSAVIDKAIYQAAKEIKNGFIKVGDEIIPITNGVPQLDGYTDRSVGGIITDGKLKIVSSDTRLFKVEIRTNQFGVGILSVKEDTAANGAIPTQTLRPKISLKAWFIIGVFILTALAPLTFHFFPSKDYSSPSSNLNPGAETERPPAEPGIYSWSSRKSGTNYSPVRLTLAELKEKILYSQTRPERNAWSLLFKFVEGRNLGLPVRVGSTPEQNKARILATLSPGDRADFETNILERITPHPADNLMNLLGLILQETNTKIEADLRRTNEAQVVEWVLDPRRSMASEEEALGPHAVALINEAKDYLADNLLEGLPPETMTNVETLFLNWVAQILRTYGPSARDDDTPVKSPSGNYERPRRPAPSLFQSELSLEAYLKENGILLPQPPSPSPRSELRVAASVTVSQTSLIFNFPFSVSSRFVSMRFTEGIARLRHTVEVVTNFVRGLFANTNGNTVDSRFSTSLLPARVRALVTSLEALMAALASVHDNASTSEAPVRVVDVAPGAPRVEVVASALPYLARQQTVQYVLFTSLDAAGVARFHSELSRFADKELHLDLATIRNFTVIPLDPSKSLANQLSLYLRQNKQDAGAALVVSPMNEGVAENFAYPKLIRIIAKSDHVAASVAAAELLRNISDEATLRKLARSGIHDAASLFLARGLSTLISDMTALAAFLSAA